MCKTRSTCSNQRTLTDPDPNSQEDHYGLIKRHPGCKVISEAPMMYSKTGITSAVRVPGHSDNAATAATSPAGATSPPPTTDSQEVSSTALALPAASPPGDSDSEMSESMHGPTDSEEVSGSGPRVPVRDMRGDSRWARRSQAVRQTRPLETPPRDKTDANPTEFSDSYLDHPWFDALLTASKDHIKVGDELVSPAVLRGVYQSMLSLDVNGSVVYKLSLIHI